MTDPDLIDALRRKSMIFHRNLTREDVGQQHLVGRIVDFTEAAAPLLRFGWSAMAER